ncbi:MAG: transcriptional repressor LexA [Clostridiales bacterium]|nr:transcriptional repressor LexA [Clostridiales bacterium]
MKSQKANDNGLTVKEGKVFAYILNCISECGYPPTVRDICKAVGLNSPSSIQHYLVSLESKGYIKRDPEKPRALEILKTQDDRQAYNKSNIVHVPLVGDIAAGTPLLAIQNIDGYFPLPASEFGGRDVYMLRVHGNSMINIGILDGDSIIVESTETAENGEIVVALIDDSATVKRFYKEDGYYRLQPENDEMEPILVDNVAIQGKVIGLLRSEFPPLNYK